MANEVPPFPVTIRRITDPGAHLDAARARFGAPSTVWRHGDEARIGYGVAALVSLALLVLVNGTPGWRVLPFLTADTGADLGALLKQIQATFGKECLPLNLPADGGTRVVDCFYSLEAPVLRVGAYNVPYPPALTEDQFLPDVDRVLDAIDKSLAF